MSSKEIKEQLIEISRAIYHTGLVNMYEGNVSARLGDVVYITPSHQNKESLTPDMIVEVDMQGAVLNPSPLYKPSAELKMHLAAYRIRSDVAAIVHTHSPFATAHALCNKSIVSKGSPETLSIHGEVPCLPYGTPGTDAVHADFDKYLPDYNALLLGNHGLIAVGANLVQAFSRAEGIESLARSLFLTRLNGGEQPLAEDEVAFLRKRRKDRMEAAKAQAAH